MSMENATIKGGSGREGGVTSPEAKRTRVEKPMTDEAAKIKQMLNGEGIFAQSGKRGLTMAEAGFTPLAVGLAFQEYKKNLAEKLGALSSEMANDDILMSMEANLKNGRYDMVLEDMQGSGYEKRKDLIIAKVKAREKLADEKKQAELRAAIRINAQPAREAVNVGGGIEYLGDLRHQAREQFEGPAPATPDAIRMAPGLQAGEEPVAPGAIMEEKAAQEAGRGVTEQPAMFSMAELQKQAADQAALKQAEAFLANLKKEAAQRRAGGGTPRPAA